MSLVRGSYRLLLLLLLMASVSNAQLFSDQGVMSGSGLTIVPTATTVPSSEFRVQYARMDYLKKGLKGMNVFGLSVGLSSSMEAYMRITGEQLGTTQSQVSYGFGGKFCVPADLPIIRRLALWFEETTSDQTLNSSLYPHDAMRGGLIATLDSNGVHPTIFLGASRIDGKLQPLVGAGVTIAMGSNAQIGLEIMRGYLELKSLQIVGSASIRVFPHISVQVSPGYLKTTTLSTWSISLGLSGTSSDIDFHPVFEKPKDDEYIVPSIDEIEKGEQQNPSDNGGGGNGSGEEQTENDPRAAMIQELTGKNYG